MSLPKKIALTLLILNEIRGLIVVLGIVRALTS